MSETPTNIEMRAILDAIWADKKCRYPGHIIRWSSTSGHFVAPGLFANPGAPRGKVRAKKKGHSYLIKGYQFAWMFYRAKDAADDGDTRPVVQGE